MSQEALIIAQLEKIIAILDRMEQRQINVKEQIQEQPQVGSFASTQKP